jgi:hypothetical protein
MESSVRLLEMGSRVDEHPGLCPRLGVQASRSRRGRTGVFPFAAFLPGGSWSALCRRSVHTMAASSSERVCPRRRGEASCWCGLGGTGSYRSLSPSQSSSLRARWWSAGLFPVATAGGVKEGMRFDRTPGTITDTAGAPVGVRLCADARCRDGDARLARWRTDVWPAARDGWRADDHDGGVRIGESRGSKAADRGGAWRAIGKLSPGSRRRLVRCREFDPGSKSLGAGMETWFGSPVG